MSRDLPPRANLDHLRKQAKELLHELQQRNSSSRLADAQHHLARDYGFASWPKLKAHVNDAAATHVPHPFVGDWIVDLSKSELHPPIEIRHATLRFDVVGDTITIGYSVIDSSGREDRGRHTFHADGTEHQSEFRPGYMVLARWSGPRSLEATVTKDAQVEGHLNYVVSPDGRTLTLSARSGTTGPKQVGVFQRG